MSRREITVVREYLSLPTAALPRRRPRRGLQLLALLTALGAATFGVATPAEAQPPYRQEVLPGLGGLDVGNRANPAFADLDGDGDYDVVGGESYGELFYFRNTGSSSAPAFMRLSGTANPFDGLDLGRSTSPVIADLDGDGDLDVLVGESGGGMTFFRSLAPLFADGFESGDTSAWSAAVP